MTWCGPHLSTKKGFTLANQFIQVFENGQIARYTPTFPHVCLGNLLSAMLRHQGLKTKENKYHDDCSYHITLVFKSTPKTLSRTY